MKKNILIIVALMLVILTSSAFAAGFMKIGDIQGESNVKGYEQWTNIDAFSYSINREVSSGERGSSRAQSRAEFNEVSVVKQFDASSPEIFEALTQGTIIPKVSIEFARDTREKTEPYLVYTYSDVVITNSEVSYGGEYISESVSFTYSKVEMKYTVFDQRGKLEQSYEAGFDIVTGKQT